MTCDPHGHLSIVKGLIRDRRGLISQSYLSAPLYVIGKEFTTVTQPVLVNSFFFKFFCSENDKPAGFFFSNVSTFSFADDFVVHNDIL